MIDLHKNNSSGNIPNQSHLLIILLFIITVFVTFGYTLRNDFIFDDELIIKDSIILKHPVNIKYLFSPQYYEAAHERFWQPLATFTHIVDYTIWKEKVFGHRLHNLILHIITSFLLYLVCLSISKSKPASIIVSLLFIIHPLVVEPVTFVYLRKDILCTIFLLAAFLSYLKKSRLSLSFTVILFLAALLTKITAMIFPILLILYDFIFVNDDEIVPTKKRFLRIFDYRGFYMLLIMFSFLFLLIRTRLIPDPEAHAFFNNVSLIKRLFNIPIIFFHYIKTVFFPVALNIDYLLLYPDKPGSSLLILSLIIAAVTLMIWLAALKFDKKLMFGITWFFLFLIPAFNIIPTNHPLSDRNAYLPLCGILLAIAVLLSKITIKNRVIKRITLAAVTITAVAPLLFLTFQRNSLIGNKEELWNDVIQKNSQSYIGHNNLGIIHASRGEQDKALEFYEKSVDINDQLYAVWFNIAQVYDRSGDVKQAIYYYNEALKRKPGAAATNNSLGLLYNRLDLPQKSVDYYSTAVTYNPLYYRSWYNMGNAWFKLENYPKAIECYSEVLAIIPNQQKALYNIGATWYTIQDLYRAKTVFMQYVRVYPEEIEGARILHRIKVELQSE